MKLEFYLGGHQRSELSKFVNIQVTKTMINIHVFPVLIGKLGILKCCKIFKMMQNIMIFYVLFLSTE
jgi:hypothetical protein